MRTFYALVKFIEEEGHARDFIAGKLYLNRLSYFKELEEGQSVNRKDRHEGVTQWLQPDQIQIEINGFDITPDLAGPVALQMNGLDHFHVFCMSALHSGNLDLSQLAAEDIGLLRQQLEIDEACHKLGRYVIVVRDIPQFINRIESAAKQRGWRSARRLVQYYDPETFHGGWEGVEPIFKKRAEYQYQNEYRFAFDRGNQGTDPTDLEIGDLSDITDCVPTRKFNSLLRIEISERINQ